LQNPSDKREILADDLMAAAFGKKRFSMFQMTKLLGERGLIQGGTPKKAKKSSSASDDVMDTSSESQSESESEIDSEGESEPSSIKSEKSAKSENSAKVEVKTE
jgi:hypothetical protein